MSVFSEDAEVVNSLGLWWSGLTDITLGLAAMNAIGPSLTPNSVSARLVTPDGLAQHRNRGPAGDPVPRIYRQAQDRRPRGIMDPGLRLGAPVLDPEPPSIVAIDPHGPRRERP
jgi:hypothetical protein